MSLPIPWVDGEFDVSADENGKILKERELQAPISGRLIRFRVKTETSCEGRSHETIIVIERVDDPSDRIEVGPIGIVDCNELEAPIDYKVRQLKIYKIKLECKGFQANEHVKGKAGVKYMILIKASDQNIHPKRVCSVSKNHFYRRCLNEIVYQTTSILLWRRPTCKIHVYLHYRQSGKPCFA